MLRSELSLVGMSEAEDDAGNARLHVLLALSHDLPLAITLPWLHDDLPSGYFWILTAVV